MMRCICPLCYLLCQRLNHSSESATAAAADEMSSDHFYLEFDTHGDDATATDDEDDDAAAVAPDIDVYDDVNDHLTMTISHSLQ